MADSDGNQNLNNQQGGDGQAPAWVAQLSDDLKGDKTFTSFKTISDLGKDYLDKTGKVKEYETKVKDYEGKVKDFEGKIASEYIPRLKENATESERQAFYKAMGVPDKPDAYKFSDFKPPKGMESMYDPTMEPWFKDQAHKLGLTQEQANGLFKAYTDGFTERATKMTVAAAEAQKAKEIEVTQQKQAAMDELKKEWGNKFDENLVVMNRALETFGTLDFKKYMDESGFGNDPRIVKVFYTIGKAMMDDKGVFGDRPINQPPREPGKMYYPSMDEKSA